MAAQLTYNYATPKGVAGGLFDIAPYRIDSRLNGETDDNKMMFGMGAVQGATPGTDVLVPTSASTIVTFEGLVVANLTNEMNMQGDVSVKTQGTLGVMRWGRGWARVVPGITPKYGDPLYLTITGTYAGFFTNVSGSGTIAVNGTFAGGLGSINVAPIRLNNQFNQVTGGGS